MKIGILDHSSISALGKSRDEVWINYEQTDSKIVYDTDLEALVSRAVDFPVEWQHPNIQKLDRVNQLATYTALQLKRSCTDSMMISYGSSRGITGLWEQHHSKFRSSPNALSPKASPDTTLGSISSWVAQELQMQFPQAVDVSMTCSSGLLAIMNGVAWIEAGMVDRALVGGVEAPLTVFSIQQLKQMKAYSKRRNQTFPNLAALIPKEENTLVLGEAAASFVLSRDPADIHIIGVGSHVEKIRYATDLTLGGLGIQMAMNTALEKAHLVPNDIDVIVTHTPGTIKGDEAELRAIESTFGKHRPYLVNNKWRIGHTYGASGAMNLDLAIHILKNKQVVFQPFIDQELPSRVDNIMVNSMGFGGIATSIIISE